jgi:LPS O-antigen subunit length determinant protein (WzzB/FepE family)
MPNSQAFPVILFMLSFYTFAIALLYVLARAWHQTATHRRPNGNKTES